MGVSYCIILLAALLWKDLINKSRRLFTIWVVIGLVSLRHVKLCTTQSQIGYIPVWAAWLWGKSLHPSWTHHTWKLVQDENWCKAWIQGVIEGSLWICHSEAVGERKWGSLCSPPDLLSTAFGCSDKKKDSPISMVCYYFRRTLLMPDNEQQRKMSSYFWICILWVFFPNPI